MAVERAGVAAAGTARSRASGRRRKALTGGTSRPYGRWAVGAKFREPARSWYVWGHGPTVLRHRSPTGSLRAARRRVRRAERRALDRRAQGREAARAPARPIPRAAAGRLRARDAQVPSPRDSRSPRRLPGGRNLRLAWPPPEPASRSVRGIRISPDVERATPRRLALRQPGAVPAASLSATARAARPSRTRPDRLRRRSLRRSESSPSIRVLPPRSSPRS